jgi:ribosomal protein L29
MNHLGDKTIDFLKNTVVSLEELQVQASLGKAELSDKFEEIKKDSLNKFNNLKSGVNRLVSDGKDTYLDLKEKLDHFEVQLALGKAETMDEINHQKKNLINTINKIKKVIG